MSNRRRLYVYVRRCAESAGAATVNADRLGRPVLMTLTCDDVDLDVKQTAASCSSVQTVSSDVVDTARGAGLVLKRSRNASTSVRRRLVGWSLTSLLSTNTAISETKGQGGELSSYPVKEGQRYIRITFSKVTATFLFSSHPKRERDRDSLWPPYVIGGPLYFCPVVYSYLLSSISVFLFSYIHTYIHTNLYSAKIVERI